MAVWRLDSVITFPGTGWVYHRYFYSTFEPDVRCIESQALAGVSHTWLFASTGKCPSLVNSNGYHFSGTSGSAGCSSWSTSPRARACAGKNRSNDTYYETLWRDLFSDPSKWWDNRLEKPNSRFPDFKHKQTGKGLWVIDGRNPPWVASEIASNGPAPGLSIFSQTQALARYNKAGQYKKTMEHFEQMRQAGINVDGHVLVHVLRACAILQDVEEGRRIHRQLLETDCELNVYVSSCLIDMYAKCGSIEEALSEFNKMPRRDVVAWTAMILGFVKCGECHKALDLFQQMQRVGVEPDSRTFVGVLNACAGIATLKGGIIVHQQIIRCGFESDVYVGNALVDMYAKCGSIDMAWRVFNKMPAHNVVSWNALILGNVKCGKGLKALELFQQMQANEVEPNSVTFIGLLNACASIQSLEEGRRIHRMIIRTPFVTNAHVFSSLVDMFAKCGSMDEAWTEFNKMPTQQVVPWTAMILGYVKCGEGLKALELFQTMQKKGVEPNSVTFVGLLNACASISALEEGRGLHEQICRNGYECDVKVGSALVDMYTKCGSMEDAWSVFGKMPSRDVVSWTAMILGYVKCGDGPKALDLFQQMQQERIEPDSQTFVVVLNACASIAALDAGRHFHKQIIRNGFESDAFVGNALVDMYSKCGCIHDALRVFNNLPTFDVVSWNAMIMGYAMNGQAKEAVALFDQMFRSNCEINEVTFVCLLSACSHGGLVEAGLQYFECMQSVYGLSPVQEHYTCLVDILGRAGRLNDAEAMVKNMPLEPCAATWMALLSACRIHGNVEMGERAFKQVLKLDQNNAGGYVLLSNIYGAADCHNGKDMVQEQRLQNGIMKQPGRTWIEVNNKMHSFVMNDCQHPQILQIREELVRLLEHVKEEGYVPDTSFAFPETEEGKTIRHLCHHSEKLAIAFGLISTPAGAPLRIVKNLRVCGDCHIVTKLISKITGRAITVRDANRFHHFNNGLCSCKEFW